MGVATLREQLLGANLDIDGSREILVKRLKDRLLAFWRQFEVYEEDYSSSSSDSDSDSYSEHLLGLIGMVASDSSTTSESDSDSDTSSSSSSD